ASDHELWRNEALLQATERRLLSTESAGTLRDEVTRVYVTGNLPSVSETKEDYVRHHHVRIAGIGLLGIIVAAGCAGKGERIDLTVPIVSGAGGKVVAMSSPTVAIQPFEDHRTDRSRLGTRHHLWGGESHFSLSNGTLSEATAQAFADYLKGKG